MKTALLIATFLGVALVMTFPLWVTPGCSLSGCNRRAGGTSENSHKAEAAPPEVISRRVDPNSPLGIRSRRAVELKAQAGEALKRGNLDQARALLEESHELLPYSPDTIHRLAKLCAEIGDRRAALDYYRKAFDPNDQMGSTLDNDPLALLEYAKVAERVSPAEAEEVYARIAAVGRDTIGSNYPKLPNSPNVRARAQAKLALAKLKGKQLAAAAEHMDQALRHAPNDPVLAFYRAYIAVEMKDFAGSKGHLTRAKAAPAGVIDRGVLDRLELRADPRSLGPAGASSGAG